MLRSEKSTSVSFLKVCRKVFDELVDVNEFFVFWLVEFSKVIQRSFFQYVIFYPCVSLQMFEFEHNFMGKVNFRREVRNKILNQGNQTLVLDKTWQRNSNNEIIFASFHDEMIISELSFYFFSIICSRIGNQHHNIALKINSHTIFGRLILFHDGIKCF